MGADCSDPASPHGNTCAPAVPCPHPATNMGSSAPRDTYGLPHGLQCVKPPLRDSSPKATPHRIVYLQTSERESLAAISRSVQRSCRLPATRQGLPSGLHCVSPSVDGAWTFHRLPMRRAAPPHHRPTATQGPRLQRARLARRLPICRPRSAPSPPRSSVYFERCCSSTGLR